MLQMICDNEYLGSSLFGQLLDNHILSSAASQAVRNRVKLIPAVLQELAVSRARPSEVSAGY